MHQIGPEGVSLPKTRDTRYNLFLKRKTIGHFMFNMAFENSLEPGYVTEKPFDAMIAGTFLFRIVCYHVSKLCVCNVFVFVQCLNRVILIVDGVTCI